MTRERLLSETFVAMADNLVEAFDLVEFLSLLSERCVELFEAEAAGVMLASPGDGGLALVASSSDACSPAPWASRTKRSILSSQFGPVPSR